MLESNPNDIIFSRRNAYHPERLYANVLMEFGKVLKTVELDARKENTMRRKLGLHSFRRFVKTIIATQTNSDYSEWLLGHSKSPYWTMKEAERREIYATKIMKYLTFLDYEQLERSTTEDKSLKDSISNCT